MKVLWKKGIRKVLSKKQFPLREYSENWQSERESYKRKNLKRSKLTFWSLMQKNWSSNMSRNVSGRTCDSPVAPSCSIKWSSSSRESLRPSIFSIGNNSSKWIPSSSLYLSKMECSISNCFFWVFTFTLSDCTKHCNLDSKNK